MGRSDKEGSPFQPDGSLLSLVGDLLFAGAILVMIYPCIRKTFSRLDGHFFRQFFHIVEILLAVAVLCFVLMLLIGQQMRIAYCSFIRPYLGPASEDKPYISVLMKILVCVLLLVNYFCASGLQKLVWFLGERLHFLLPARQRLVSARPPHISYAAFGDALTNNSNTNSQTPVTQTQSVMQSDILPFMSFSHLSTESYQDPAACNDSTHRDVGTMVRFPVSEYQQHGTQGTIQHCCAIAAAPPYSPRPSAAPPATVLFSSFPSTTPTATASLPPRSRMEASSHRQSSHQVGRVIQAESSCHVHVHPQSSSQPRWGVAGGWPDTGHSRMVSSCPSCASERSGSSGAGPGGVETDPPTSCYSSDWTPSSGSGSSSSSSGGSNQSSFLSSLGLTGVRNGQPGPGPRFTANVESGFHRNPGPTCGPPSVAHPTATTTLTGHAAFQSCPGSVWTSSGGGGGGGGVRPIPMTSQSGFCLSHSSALAVNSHLYRPVSCSTCVMSSNCLPHNPAFCRACVVSSNNPVTSCTGAVLPHTHFHSCSHAECCVLAPTRTESNNPPPQPSETDGVCSPTPSSSVSRVPSTTPRQTRRRQLPPMPKMTRSGKIYGYG
ncbi:hypothetical protein ACOMHN_013731 [Nucella lapillus]